MAEDVLRRYTQLPSLIYMLREKKLTLLNPSSWDDKNDSYFLEQYKSKRKLKTVLALCFSTARETYHHWNIFAGGSAGVCIQFKRDGLLEAIKGWEGVHHKEVSYLRIDENRRLKVKELPFTKRFPFQDESELRIIYESKAQKKSTHDVEIPLSSISRINLSPWLPELLKEHVKKTLCTIKDCSELNIARSTLISNERWKRMGEEAT
jgi:hypothetical protein